VARSAEDLPTLIARLPASAAASACRSGGVSRSSKSPNWLISSLSISARSRSATTGDSTEVQSRACGTGYVSWVAVYPPIVVSPSSVNLAMNFWWSGPLAPCDWSGWVQHHIAGPFLMQSFVTELLFGAPRVGGRRFSHNPSLSPPSG
jgi:hypothetical protein